MVLNGIEITNSERIVFTKGSITKGDVAKYYSKNSDKILPFLKDRAVSLVRNPKGLKEKGFFQKHPQESFPQYIERVRIKEESGGSDLYITLDSVEDLVFLSNIGVIEYHTWLSKVDDLEHPDIFIFDLDPDRAISWQDLCEGAFWLKERLNKDGFETKARVSGGKGIHIIGEYKKKTNWDDSKSYTRGIAEELAAENKLFITSMSKKERRGKVFVDFYRNSRGSTAIVPYSLRSREGGGICMEVEWEQLKSIGSSDKFKIRDFI